MKRTKAENRLLAALHLAGDRGATTLELMDATGVHSGDFYRVMYGLHLNSLIDTTKDSDGRARYFTPRDAP